MDDTGAVCDGDYLRLVEFVGASEDIDMAALRGELAGELADIYIHAAGVLLAEAAYGAAVEAYQGEFEHGGAWSEGGFILLWRGRVRS